MRIANSSVTNIFKNKYNWYTNGLEKIANMKCSFETTEVRKSGEDLKTEETKNKYKI